MSDHPNSGEHRAPTIIKVLLAVLITLQVVTLWHMFHGGSSLPGKTGALYSVQLVNGQVIYGHLDESGPNYVRLSQLYSVAVSAPNATTGARESSLINLRKADPNAPDAAIISADKILMMEAVGTDSRVAKLIEADQNPSQKQ